MENQTIIETQNHEQIIGKPSPLWPKFLGIGLLILIIVGVLFFKNNKIIAPEKNPPTAQTTQAISQIPSLAPQESINWKTYTLENDFSIKYPPHLILEENKNYIIINDLVNLRVLSAQPSLVTRPNLDLTMGIGEKTVDQLQKEDSAEEIKLGNNTFYRTSIGAEGSGEYSYHLPIRNNTEVFKFSFIYFRAEDVNSEDRKNSNYLSPDEEKKLVENILSTVTIKPNNISPTTQIKYTCPASEYVDCMPGPGPAKENCSPEFLNWAQENCPNFKGGAY